MRGFFPPDLITIPFGNWRFLPQFEVDVRVVYFHQDVNDVTVACFIVLKHGWRLGTSRHLLSTKRQNCSLPAQYMIPREGKIWPISICTLLAVSTFRLESRNTSILWMLEVPTHTFSMPHALK